MAALDTSGLRPLDTSGLEELDTSGLKPLDTSGLRPLEIDDDDQPGRLRTASSQFARGLGSVASGLPKSVGLIGTPDPDIFRNFDRIDQGKFVIPKPIQGNVIGVELADPMESLYEDYIAATPEQRQAIRKTFEDRVREAQEGPAYRTGQSIDKFIADNFPVNPELQDEFWSSKVPQALGSATGFAASAFVTRGALGGGTAASFVAPAALGSAVNRVDQFESALAEGAEIGDALRAAQLGGIIGTTEAIPIGNLLNRLDRVSGGQVKRYVARAVQQGTEEAVQEAFSGILNAAVAQNLYDPERGIWTAERGEEAAVGFTTGAILETLVTLALPGRRRGSVNLESPESVQANAEARLAELEASDSLSEVETDERDFLRENRTRPSVIAEAYGIQMEPLGERDKAREAPPELTEDDIASPIPDDLILEGKAVVQDALAADRASEALREAGFPEVDTDVVVDGEPARVVDAIDGGAKIEYEDGQAVPESFESLSGRVRAVETDDAREVRSDTRQGDQRRDERQTSEIEGRSDLQQPAEERPGASDRPRQAASAPEAETQGGADETLDTTGLTPVEPAEFDLERLRQTAQVAPETGRNDLETAIRAIERGAAPRDVLESLQAASDAMFRQTPAVSEVVDELIESVASQSTDTFRGSRIDDEWVNFSPNIPSPAIPRDRMPQIKAEHRGALANFLKARGIEGNEETVAANTLKPTQAEFSEKKVEKAKAFEGGDRAILVSSDGHILDGHHQWMAAVDDGNDIRIIRLDAPIDDLLTVVPEFPSAEGGDGGQAAAGVTEKTQTPVKKQEHSMDLVWTAGLNQRARADLLRRAGIGTPNDAEVDRLSRMWWEELSERNRRELTETYRASKAEPATNETEQPASFGDVARALQAQADTERRDRANRPNADQWPQPNSNGVYSEEDAERDEFKSDRAKRPKGRASITVIQAYEGEWLSATSFEFTTGSMSGMTQPLSYSSGQYESREAAYEAGRDLLLQRLEQVANDNSSTANDAQREAARKLIGQLSPPEGGNPLADMFAEQFREGATFKFIAQARKAAGDQLGRKIQPGTADTKLVDEAIELGVIIEARRIVAQGLAPQETYRQLVDLYKRMPKLGARTSTSIEQQAYSTPAPLAYLAAQAAGIDQNTTVYEPSAGNGALLMTADPAKVTANELNGERAANLRDTLPGATVTEDDAAASRPNGPFDVVIANPPFGPIKNEEGKTVRFQVDERYETAEIDHAISLKSLESMDANGSAVLLVASVKKTAKTDEQRSDAYNVKAKREFYLTLYEAYNVVDHFTVSGELYERQGAGWPVDVIVIRGRKPSQRKVPAADVPRRYTSWEELGNVLDTQYEQATDGARAPDRGRAAPARQPPASDERGRTRGREDRVDRQPGSAAAGERAGVRQGSVDRQPADARPAEPAPRRPARPAESERPARRPRRTEVSDNARQVAYTPVSSARPMDTLVPVNMQTSVDDALSKLRGKVGNLDAFVSERLGYSPDNLGDYFGAEQVDAIALALDNMERGAGFIIGDQTGIGKGRVVAAMIRYALREGRTPIFVTEKPNLYGDMYRDMNDIGIPEMLGREPDMLMTNAAQRVPLDDSGEKVLRSKAAATHNAMLKKFAEEGSIEGYDVVFTTYSQMQTVRGAETPRMQFLDAIAEGGIVIMDESHNAGGTASGERQAKSQELNRAEFARRITRKAHGVFYSSATYAKRPDVMDLYASTDMSLAVSDISNLGEAISKGGVPMQQVVASMLSRSGQYIRRERSFDGVMYNSPVIKVPRTTYASYSQALAGIQSFSELFIGPATKRMDKELKAEGKQVSADGSTGGAGAASTNFTAIMHNLIDQMLLSIKADAAAERAIKAIENGEKPVITVSNTMGSFIADFAEDMGIAPGERIKIDFNELLERYLDRTRRITVRQPFMKKGEKGKQIYLTDEMLGPQGVARFEAVREQIRAIDFSVLPVSPIDHIRRKLVNAGYSVGEITGRQNTIDYRPDGDYYRRRSTKEISIAGRQKAKADFNSGKMDAMILNQAGSTGLSLHASSTFKDQKKRRMIIAQAEKNIDTHMQMLGRVHRTGQVVTPEYDQLVANVPAEKRPAAVLAKKMASLNANTTASRGGALTADDVPDFINQYGDLVAYRLMADMPEIHTQLGEPLKSDQPADAMRKVTGRIPLLPLDQQELIYDLLESEYKALVEQKEAAGESILEAKTLPLDARTLTRTQTVAPLSGEDSPFADAVYLETVDVKRLSKPHPQSKVLDMIADSIGVERDTLSGDNIDNIVQQGRKAAQALVAENREDIQAYRQEVLDEIENEKRRSVAEEKLNGQIQRIGSFLRTAPVGQPVRLMTNEGNFYGVVTSIKPTGKTKNPAALGSWKVTFAMADASRQITLPLSQMATEETKPTNVDDLIIVEPATNITNDLTVYQAFDELQNELREERTMVTGNILAGFEHVNGRGAIVNFTDTEGNVRQGILMPREYDYVEARQSLPVLFRTTDQVIEFVSQGHRVESSDEAVELRQMGNSVRIDVAASKRKGGRYYLDKGVRDAAGGDFVKVGNVMRLDVPMQNAQAVTEALRKTGAAFRAIDGLEAARTIVGGQEAPEQFSLTDKAERKMDAVQANLQERLKQIGIDDRIAQKTVNMILDQRGQPILGARGRYVRRTIEVAMTARDPAWTFNHEVIHALRDLDLITASEWSTLKRAVAADKPLMTLIQRRYGARRLSSEQMYEEAVADMHANWVDGKFRPSAGIGRIFERIRDFLEALANAWRGNGFNSVGQIFRRIQAGEVGQRGRQGVPRDMRGASEGSFATVFHGSPHVFNEFTTDAMGSGEGNQTFGWGLYFAEVKEVARGYQARLSAGRGIHDSDVIARVLEGTDGDRVRAYKELKSRGVAANRREPGSGERFDRMADKVRAGFDPRGQLYEVTIPDKVVERMLDWDASIEHDGTLMRELVDDFPESQNELMEIAGAPGTGYDGQPETHRSLYEWLDAKLGGQQQASKYLSDSGIPGIRYRDGFSRNADGNTRNLVLFDPSDITQVKRNGEVVSGREELFSLEPSNFNRRRARRAKIKFDKEETERRWQEARKGLAGQRTLYSVVRDSLNNVAQGFARHYRELPNQAEFSEAREKLRAIEAAPQAAKEEALRTLRTIVDGMTPADVELFTRKVVLDDLTYEVGQDHQLPFDMSPADVRRELAKVNDALTPQMRDRVQLRNRLVRQVADELVRSGVLSEEQVRNPAYYRHQVLDYARAQVNRAKTAGKKLRSPMWARRLGSRLDINANLLEAEFEWLQKALTDVAVADTIEWFKDSNYNIRNDVVASARAHNQALVDGILAQDLAKNSFEKNGRMTSPLNEEWKSFKQRIAVGLKQVREAIESGDVLGIPAALQPAAASLGSDTSSSNVFPLLSWIIDNDQPGSIGAAMAFKAINQRKLWMKTALGDRYADTLDLDGLVKRGFAPDNYTTWQPDEGNLLFTAKTIPEHVMDRMLDKIASDGAGKISPAELRAALDSVKSIMAVGGPKYQLVIRDELADTFNSLRDEQADGLIESAFSTPLAYWKRWVLINPRRVIKYNLNNLSGDLDAVIAGSPRVVRKLPQAIRELWQVMIRGATPSDRYREAVDRGVFDSGLTIQEIPDIQYLDEFETLINPPSPIKNPLRYFTSRLVKVWRALQRYTWFRENWMRYAAYLDYVERLEAGESMRSIGYGAGKREMVDAIADDKDKAALLARELVGDYGAISHYGQGIRRKLIPFYSWMEINTKRYWRLGGNAWDQGIGAGFRQAGVIGASLGVRTTTYLTLRMAMLYGMVQLWNNLVMGDEEEELSVQERARLHITLGRDENNNIRTLRFQGAMSDFLGWIGFEDALAMAAEVERGRATAGDVAQVMAKAPVNRVLNGMTPVISAPVEYLSGKKYWPDVFRPRPIRDPARNFAQLFSVEHEYDVIFNKPSRGYTASIEQTVVYKRNLGQNAYNRIKGLSYDWLRREKGLEGSGGYITPRSQALYEWRMAKKLGDTSAERKAERRLAELGVSGTDLRRSVLRAHPLGAISIGDRPAFLKSLHPKERAMLDQAIDWYEETYLNQ